MSKLEPTNVNELTTKINDLSDSRKNLITQLKSLSKRRLELRDEIGDITSKLAEEQAELDPFYNQIKSRRQERQELIKNLKSRRQERQELIKNLIKLRVCVNDTSDALKLIESSSVKSKIKEQRSPNNRKFQKKDNDKNLSKKIQENEWKLQTQQLTRQEEKQIVEHIRTLQIKYQHWRKSSSTRKELSKYLKDIKKLSSQLKSFDDSTNSLSSQLKSFDDSTKSIKVSFDGNKQIIATKIENREELFREMNGFNDDIRELEKVLKKSDQESHLLKSQRSEIIKSIKVGYKSEVLKKKKVILEKEKTKAKEKLESGQALSFDELRLAFDEDDDYLI